MDACLAMEICELGVFILCSGYHCNVTYPDGLGPSEPFGSICKSGIAALIVMGVLIVIPAAEYVPGPTHSVEFVGVDAFACATEVKGC